MLYQFQMMYTFGLISIVITMKESKAVMIELFDLK